MLNIRLFLKDFEDKLLQEARKSYRESRKDGQECVKFPFADRVLHGEEEREERCS